MFKVTITETNPLFGTTTTSIEDAEHSALLQAREDINTALANREAEAALIG